MGTIQRCQCSDCDFDSGPIQVGPGIRIGGPTYVVVSCSQCAVVAALPTVDAEHGCPVHHTPLAVFADSTSAVPCPCCGAAMPRQHLGCWD
jgi:hypothetical protein